MFFKRYPDKCINLSSFSRDYHRTDHDKDEIGYHIKGFLDLTVFIDQKEVKFQFSVVTPPYEKKMAGIISACETMQVNCRWQSYLTTSEWSSDSWGIEEEPNYGIVSRMLFYIRNGYPWTLKHADDVCFDAFDMSTVDFCINEEQRERNAESNPMFRACQGIVKALHSPFLLPGCCTVKNNPHDLYHLILEDVINFKKRNGMDIDIFPEENTFLSIGENDNNITRVKRGV